MPENVVLALAGGGPWFALAAGIKFVCVVNRRWRR